MIDLELALAIQSFEIGSYLLVRALGVGEAVAVP
jgi:hypothetical protein